MLGWRRALSVNLTSREDDNGPWERISNQLMSRANSLPRIPERPGTRKHWTYKTGLGQSGKDFPCFEEEWRRTRSEYISYKKSYVES